MIAACAEVISDRGYDRTTISAITTTAAISKKDFYRAFAGLEDCVTATYRTAAESAATASFSCCRAAGEGEDGLTSAVSGLLSLSAEEPELAYVLTDPALVDIPEVAAARAEVVARFAEVLAKARGRQAAGCRHVHLVRGAQQWLSNRLTQEGPGALPDRTDELAQLLAVA